MPEPVSLVTLDGVTLEAELARPPTAGPEDAGPVAGMVLCHPHPQFGGSMRSIVISALFAALPAAGVTCLRFNFRGVEGSSGTYDEGRAECTDAATAVQYLHAEVGDAIPLVLTGWSFGADVALSIRGSEIDAWLVIAPPLRFAHDLDDLAQDRRPKLFALAEHDEFRPPGEVAAIVADWRETTVEVVGGASHFFVGRTDRLVDLARAFVAEVGS